MSTSLLQSTRLLLVALIVGLLLPWQARAQLVLFGDSEEPLAPEQAFVASIKAVGENAVDVNFAIADGYYLYRDKTHFTEDGTLTLGTAVGSDAEITVDDYFGEVAIYRHDATFRIPYQRNKAGNGAEEFTLDVNFQGCADIGLCYPPTTTALLGTLPASASTGGDGPMAAVASDNSNTLNASAGSNGGDASGNTAQRSVDGVSEQDRLSLQLGQKSLWFNVAAFFGLGLLLAFTPCVLPMVPILSSMIVGQRDEQGNGVSTRRAFLLSLVYVLVMASTYAVLGTLVAISGYNIQAFLQSPWVLGLTALIFLVLALSMFGAFELQMPAAIQNRLTTLSNRQTAGSFGGVAAMGLLSTLIVGPCVTAPLAGALLYIADSGNAWVGGSALFALGLGMGAPLLLIGTSAGHLLPRAGAWMERVRTLFGLLLVAMAIYLLSRFLPAPISMMLFGVLAVVSGFMLGGFDTLKDNSGQLQRFAKGLSMVLAVYGIALLVGAWSGSGSYLRPLARFGGAVVSTDSSPNASLAENQHALPFRSIKGLAGLQAALADAQVRGQPVMLDFYADWCISCKEMENFTFKDTRVQAALSNTLLLQADVTANDAADQELLKAFRLFGPPAIIFHDASGNELKEAQVVGFMNADKFTAHLQRHIPEGGGLDVTSARLSR